MEPGVFSFTWSEPGRQRSPVGAPHAGLSGPVFSRSAPGVGLEETSENEGRDRLHPLSLQQEPREVMAGLV